MHSYMPLLNQIVSYAAVALFPVTGMVVTASALFPGLFVRCLLYTSPSPRD